MKLLGIMKTVQVLRKMAFLLILFSLSVIPDVALATASLRDCGGPDKLFIIKKGSVIPDPVEYPGNISLKGSLQLIKDLPSENIELCINLVKLEPKMEIPCMNGMGSCCYDICEMLETHENEFCPMFPADTECSCPLRAATYKMKKTTFSIPDFGDIFISFIKGDYEGRIKMTDAETNKEIGCIQIKFRIVTEK